MAASPVKPMPERMVKSTTAPAPGAAGVPTEATSARIMIRNREPTLTS